MTNHDWIVPLQTVILGVCGWILLTLYRINLSIGEIRGAIFAVNIRIDAHIREDDILHFKKPRDGSPLTDKEEKSKKEICSLQQLLGVTNIKRMLMLHSKG